MGVEEWGRLVGGWGLGSWSAVWGVGGGGRRREFEAIGLIKRDGMIRIPPPPPAPSIPFGRRGQWMFKNYLHSFQPHPSKKRAVDVQELGLSPPPSPHLISPAHPSKKRPVDVQRTVFPHAISVQTPPQYRVVSRCPENCTPPSRYTPVQIWQWLFEELPPPPPATP